jgi:hypothetical protein
MIESVLDTVATTLNIARESMSYETYNGRNFLTIPIYHKGEPCVVCRLPRRSSGDLEREYRNIRRVGQYVSQNHTLRRTTERVITVCSVGDRYILVKRFLPGTKAGELPADASTVGRFLRSSTHWLSEFIETTAGHRTRGQEAKRECLRELTGEANTARVTQFVEDDDCFVGPMHGDFSPGNILLGDRNQLTGVIDFEWFTPRGLPLFDLVHLIVEAGVVLYDTPEKTAEQTFGSQTAFTDHIETTVDRFRKRHALSASTIRRAVHLYPAIQRGHGHETDGATEHLLTAIEESSDIIWL